MAYNNTMHRLFQEMLDGYKTENDGLFEHGVRCMMDQNPSNPFNDGSNEAEYFFQMYNSYLRWKNHGADMKINRRRMLAAASELCTLVFENPYKFDKEEAKRDQEIAKKLEDEIRRLNEEKQKAKELEEKQKEEAKKQLEKKTEELEDSRYVLLAMTKACNEKNNTSFEQFTIHLMDISNENPFKEGSQEYLVFDEMMEVYKKHNMRRVFVLAKDLCDIINYTEIEPIKIEKKTILGVLPEEEEKEKKSWFRFLHPWKKEGVKNDSE